MMSFPKGVRAKVANLKCCLANGIPMMVMAKRIPKTKWESAIQIPPINIQIIFMIDDKQPELAAESTTLLPKGHNANTANFMV